MSTPTGAQSSNETAIATFHGRSRAHARGIVLAPFVEARYLPRHDTRI